MNTKQHGGTTADIQNAQAHLTLAQQAVDRAQGAYGYVQNRPDSDALKAQTYTTLYNARQALISAQNNLNYFLLIPSGRDIDLARAKVALAQAQLDDAKSEWTRLQNGPDPNDVAAAQARVDAAQATANLSRLTAPFSGTLSEVSPLVGDQVSPGASGFRIDDLEHLLVDVQVSEVDINSVKVNQPVAITFDAVPLKDYQGKVTAVAAVGTSVQGVVNFTVTVQLDNADADVKPGMTAAVTITVKQLENVILVPNRAVRLVNNQRVVYVLRDGNSTEIPITLGATAETMSEVLSGDLKEGDKVILNPPTNFSRPQNGGGGGGFFGGGG
jgi:HlyD family secretion protein